jgi:hypothetical protein
VRDSYLYLLKCKKPEAFKKLSNTRVILMNGEVTLLSLFAGFVTMEFARLSL